MEIDSTSASILLDFFKLDKVFFFILAITFIVLSVRGVTNWSLNLQNKFQINEEFKKINELRYCKAQ